MTNAVAIMYAVAALALAGGAWLLLRLRGRPSQEARYAHAMVGTMAAALGVILAIFATAQWSWSAAS